LTINAAYVLIGLLYGNGDLEQSMRISMRCGQDSYCNPSTVGGILGNFIGYSAIPSKWKSALNVTNTNFYATDYSYNDSVNLNIDLARQSLLMSGGSINGTTWNLPDQDPVLPPILEQWPLVSNDKPVLIASAEKPLRMLVSALRQPIATGSNRISGSSATCPMPTEPSSHIRTRRAVFM
jgi:hypothetical protein